MEYETQLLAIAQKISDRLKEGEAKIRGLETTIAAVTSLTDAILLKRTKPVEELGLLETIERIKELDTYVIAIRDSIKVCEVVVDDPPQSSASSSSSDTASSTLIKSFGDLFDDALTRISVDPKMIRSLLGMGGFAIGGSLIAHVLDRDTAHFPVNIFCSSISKMTFARNLIETNGFSFISTNSGMWANGGWVSSSFGADGIQKIHLYHRSSDPEKDREPFVSEIDCISCDHLNVFYDGKFFDIKDVHAFKQKAHRKDGRCKVCFQSETVDTVHAIQSLRIESHRTSIE